MVEGNRMDFVGRGERLVDVQRERQAVRLKQGLDGIPRLSSAGLIKPRPIILTESVSVWIRRSFSRPVYVWAPNQRRTIRYLPEILFRDGADHITRGEYQSSTSGVARIPAAGIWFLNTPIVAAEGTRVAFLYADSVNDVGMGVEDIAGESAGGGAAGSGVAYVWLTLAAIVVGAASAAVVAASATRKGIYLYNSSTGGQTIAVTTEAPATAITRGLAVLPQGIGTYLLGEACPQSALNAFGSAAGGSLTVATAT